MKVHLPTYLGGDEVNLETDGLSDNEQIVGWVDENGTITSSRANVVIGDLVAVTDREYFALVINTGELEIEW